MDVSPAVEASTGGQSLKEQVDSLETVLMQHTQALQMVAELLVNVQVCGWHGGFPSVARRCGCVHGSASFWIRMTSRLLFHHDQAQAAADRIRAAQQYVKLTEELKAAPRCVGCCTVRGRGCQEQMMVRQTAMDQCSSHPRSTQRSQRRRAISH